MKADIDVVALSVVVVVAAVVLGSPIYIMQVRSTRRCSAALVSGRPRLRKPMHVHPRLPLHLPPLENFAAL